MKKTQKTIEEKFKKLTEVEHCLMRPGRYLGSINPHTSQTWLYQPDKMVKQECTWNPAFIKMFDEVISNSVDHSKREEGKHLTTIKVEVDQTTGEICIFDNGGIPVVLHRELNQYVPEMIFELRAGSNFDDADESTLTGQNGEGAALTNIFSKYFIVETCDAHNKFKMKFEENSQVRNKPKVTEAEGSKGFTKIVYLPDYERLGTTLDAGNYAMLYKRTVDIAALNPHLKVYWQGERINIPSFKDYIKLYADEFIYDDNEHWKIGISHSLEGFQHISFVNTTQTNIGGTHIDYIANQVVAAVRAYLLKKHKVDVRPAEIKQHLQLFIDATIINPRYSSQTKDELITEIKDYKTSFEVTDKFIKKLLGTSIIQAVLDWVAAKEEAAKKAEMRKLNKDINKTDARRVEKLTDATEKKERWKCSLVLTEGDSARTPIQSARDPRYMGVFPLKGKPINVSGTDVKKLMGNAEFTNIMIATGLQLGVDEILMEDGEWVEVTINSQTRLVNENDVVIDNNVETFVQAIMTEKATKRRLQPTKAQLEEYQQARLTGKIKRLPNLRYGKIIIASDQDLDGIHVSGLLINMFRTYWPDMLKNGMLYRLKTPVIKVWTEGKKKEELWFFYEHEYEAWATANPEIKHRAKWYKGLGTSSTKEFKEYLARIDELLVPLTIKDLNEDFDALDLAFDPTRADDRKEWLSIR